MDLEQFKKNKSIMRYNTPEGTYIHLPDDTWAYQIRHDTMSITKRIYIPKNCRKKSLSKIEYDSFKNQDIAPEIGGRLAHLVKENFQEKIILSEKIKSIETITPNMSYINKN